MAPGARRSYLIPLTDIDKYFIINEIRAIGANEHLFEFRDFKPTGYSQDCDIIYISSSVFPSNDGSICPTDLLSVRATLAHEYYGHRAKRKTKLEEGSWNDEFRASYLAAKKCPNLTDYDRHASVVDAIWRASKAGVKIKSNSFISKWLYGIE